MLEKLLLLLLTTIALISDLRWRQIPNWLLLFILPGMAVKWYSGELTDALWGGAVAIAIHLPAYIYGWVGGGDVKLAFSLAICLGKAFFPAWLFTALYSGILGGLVLFRNRGVVGFFDLVALISTGKATSGNGFPYAVALALGTWTAMLKG